MNPNDISTPHPEEDVTTPNLLKDTITTPLTGIGIDHIIQPISSEAEIRQAVAENTPGTTYSTTSVNHQPLSKSPEQNLTVTYNNPVNITPTPISVANNPSYDLVTQPPKKNHKWFIIPIVILVLLFVGYFADLLSLALGSSDIIKANDLVDMRIVFDTGFQRPRQWVYTNATGMIYKDPSGLAFLIVTRQDQVQKLINADEATYETRRNLHMHTSIDVFATIYIATTGRKCTSSPTTKTAADRYVVDNSVGLYLDTATCPTKQGDMTMKERTIVGKDGSIRTITIVAPNKQWSEDDEVFNTILHSIRQI